MALQALILQDCLAAPAGVHNQNIVWEYPLFAKKIATKLYLLEFIVYAQTTQKNTVSLSSWN